MTSTPQPAIPEVRKLKPFGVKAHDFAFRWPALDKRITILEGAVRSSKTWATIIKLIILCKYDVAGQRLITGRSKATIKSNVLNDLFEIIGNKNYDYNMQSGELRLFDTLWRVLAAGDEGSEKYLRGSTVGVAVSDELTLTPKSFTLMLLSRLSPEGARWYSTTNADNPYHYVKTDLIDNPDLEQYRQVISFGLDDNPNISDEYKEFIKRSYTGIWFKRFILGLWLQAEGAIFGPLVEKCLYSDSERPIGLLSPRGHVDRCVSIDAGTTNAQVYGDFYDDGNTVWLENSYYWDSRKEGSQKSNGAYADDLINGYGDWPGIGADSRDWPIVIVDPSAASFKVELRSRGLVVVDGENEVQEGLRRVASVLDRRKLRMHRRCKEVVTEMESYSWNDKKAENGDEQPLKKHDHGPDMIRMFVSTRIPDWRIAA